MLGFVLFAYTWYVVAPVSAERLFDLLANQDRYVDVLLCTLIAVPVGGIVAGLTGGSIGKSIFGIKVVNANGQTIGVMKGLGREFYVWWAGIAFGIPLIALITMERARQKLKERGTTSWDTKFESVVLHRPNGRFQYFLNGVGIILIVVVNGIAVALSRMQ